MNSTVGAVDTNLARIEVGFAEARAAGADLVVTPELALGGYPPRDLLEREAFVEALDRGLERLAALTAEGGALLVGTVRRDELGTSGKNLFNVAAFLADGRVARIVKKSLLPTYDVFDEARYFEPGRAEDVACIDYLGRRLAVTICEDLWNDASFWARRLYDFDPVEALVADGAEVVINLSASPFYLGKQALRRGMLSSLAVRVGLPVLHCNSVGGNDELIFDGASFAAWPDGSVSHVATSFEEDSTLVDLESSERPSPPMDSSEEEQAVEALTLGVRDYFRKCGFKKAVVGLSGGIDSALTTAIAVRALGPDRVVGITMPSRYSSDGSVLDSQQLAALLGIDCHVVPIRPVHAAYHEELASLWQGAGGEPETTGVTDQNIQARIRGNILMAWSNRSGALVLSTGNKSELAVGYCTLYGDMAGGLAVISDLPKTFVYRVARWLNRDAETIPQNTIDKPPSAELAPDQKDTDSLPPYEVLDDILSRYLEQGWSAERLIAETEHGEALIARVVRLVDRNEYKRRQAAPGLRVTTKAFGSGRRFPVAARLQYHKLERPGRG